MIVFNMNNPKSRIRDTFVLKLHLFVAKYLGLCPFAFGKKRHNLGKHFIPWIVLMASMVMSIGKGYTFLTNYNKLTDFGVALYSSYAITQTSFYLSLLFNSVRKINDWEYLMVKLSKFDDICGSQYIVIDRKKWKIFGFISIRLILLSYAILDVVMWPRSNITSYFVQFLPLHIAFFYEASIATMVWEFSKILKTRYDFLTNNFENILGHIKTKEGFDKEIRKMKIMYKILHQIVNGLNSIFGNVILIYLANLQIFILTAVYWMAFYWDNDLRFQLFLGSFLTLLLFSVSTLIILT